MREAEELREATEEYFAQPLDENLFEWHFTVKGPADSDFENGFYHGRIILPNEYPMKPPSIILLSQSGRFEVNKKICLSISGHHPESWQPSWSIRTALLAIIGFMPTEGLGAIGSLDFSPDERKDLALKSASWHCPTCGLISELLKKPSAGEASAEQLAAANQQKELAKQICFKGSIVADKMEVTPVNRAEASEESPEIFNQQIADQELIVPGTEVRQRRPVAEHSSTTDTIREPTDESGAWATPVVQEAVESQPRTSTYVIIVLSLAIGFLFFRRLLMMS
jgi:ubiquitin-conjugating enzyme E2 J1